MAEIVGEILYGFADFVVVHLPWLSFGFYLMLLFPTVASRARGWASSLERWCWGLGRKRMLARLKAAAGPHDPMDLIDGATRCEMAGEWARAVVLFRMAGDLLKGTPDATYVANCIRRIEEKRERVRGI
ncbi:hypothetical protein [Paludisphaera soli]|uniref:hypothetical protein n=1 Tax=Paludisphaera soli TaxID=2712865 RepID=UPI0013EB293E|nr:hypothetical protein [Paludisphaera soli]